MLRPSYNDLINVVNSEVEQGEQPVIQSRYSIVLATAKRARQLIAEGKDTEPGIKPLSVAVGELYEGKIKVLGDDSDLEEDAIILDK